MSDRVIPYAMTDWTPFDSGQYSQKGFYRRIGSDMNIRLYDNECIERPYWGYGGDGLFKRSKETFSFDDSCLPTGYKSDTTKNAYERVVCIPYLGTDPLTGKIYQSRYWNMTVSTVGWASETVVADSDSSFEIPSHKTCHMKEALQKIHNFLSGQSAESLDSLKHVVEHALQEIKK